MDSEHPDHIDTEQLANWFTYHAPHSDHAERYTGIRGFGHDFAHQLTALCPPGP